MYVGVEVERVRTVNAFGEKSMVAIDCQEVLRKTSVGIFRIRLPYRMSFTVVLPRLQLWHLYCLVSLQSVGDMHAQLHFLSCSRRSALLSE